MAAQFAHNALQVNNRLSLWYRPQSYSERKQFPHW